MAFYFVLISVLASFYGDMLGCDCRIVGELRNYAQKLVRKVNIPPVLWILLRVGGDSVALLQVFRDAHRYKVVVSVITGHAQSSCFRHESSEFVDVSLY